MAGRDTGAGPIDGPAPAARPDWRETLRAATDLALLGILTSVASVPVLTAGAAFATASTAIHRWSVDGYWPGLRELAGAFGRGLLPGAGATAAALGTAALLGGNLLLVSAGVVPGGTVLLAGTVLLVALLAGLAGVVVVQVGRRGGTGWWAAARTVGRLAERRPLAMLAAAAVVSLAAVLATLVMPLLTPILLGYTLFALHTVLRRLAPEPS
ncbi:hypothetical protein ACN27F_14895 [Solwaraspora sp. WMMB335]|uniref:hypothetical protein n=1 Tax=Solwaraspora sp. WMMB335 TaxID=3404118 RepID=UPI003B937F4E